MVPPEGDGLVSLAVLQGLQEPTVRQSSGQDIRAHGKSRSIAMIPSRCHAATRGLFVILSMPGQNGWAVHMLHEYALLADTLWSAYQRKACSRRGRRERTAPD